MIFLFDGLNESIDRPSGIMSSASHQEMHQQAIGWCLIFIWNCRPVIIGWATSKPSGKCTHQQAIRICKYLTSRWQLTCMWNCHPVIIGWDISKPLGKCTHQQAIRICKYPASRWQLICMWNCHPVIIGWAISNPSGNATISKPSGYANIRPADGLLMATNLHVKLPSGDHRMV